MSTIAPEADLASNDGMRGAQTPGEADYAAAAAILEGNLQGLVRNEAVLPNWIGASGKFWYRRDGEAGPEFVVVGPDGTKSPAFDHAKVACALGEALGEKAKHLPETLSQVRFSADLSRLLGRIGNRSVECDLKTLQCRAVETPASTPELFVSPDGRRAAFIRDDNLFVREMASGEERPLTSDGAPFHSWGKLPDSAVTTVPRKKSGQKTPPFETHWSPDGRYLIAPRLDERHVGINPMVESVPTDGSRRPIMHEVRLTFVGDRTALEIDYRLFDLETGRSTPIELPEDYRPGMTGLVLGWSVGRGQAFLMAQTIGSASVRVLRLDLATAVLSDVLEQSSAVRVEHNTMLYSQPNIRLIGDGAELIWYSDRSGWGHLYLYDAQTGALRNAITSGDWLALDILAVDEEKREIYFTGLGREPGRDPYFRHLYRGSLDDAGAITLLTAPDADHHFQPGLAPYMAQMWGITPPDPLIAPAAEIFVDTWSTVDQPPISVLRSTRDGRQIAEIERADASRLFAAGWSPPIRERIKAADGETDLYAVYYPPRGRSDGIRRPVIAAAYAGPQIVVAARNFCQAYRSGNPLGQSALARLGFAVLTLDARGTPMRASAFRDVGYVDFTQVAVEDHVAAIQGLARRYPEMDLDRVGVYGWSWGGTFAAQAILSRPDVFKVAVSGAGVYDYCGMSPGFENMTGAPVFADGSRFCGATGDYPANWEKLDITRLADQLAGHLLIAYGDMDENVPPHQAMRLVDALTRAGKPYDLLCLPNRTHAAITDGYLIKRSWDYFVEHLLGGAPVWDFKVEMRPLSFG